MKDLRQDKELSAWFTGRLPDGWSAGPVEVEGDRDEILVTVPLTDPVLGADADPEEHSTARQARIEGFREDTRQNRMRIAKEAQRQFGRKVSWAARIGDEKDFFTTLAAPAMTRLRLPERRVLDTLIEAGVARSRAEALVWCVRLVGQHEAEWLSELRSALESVEAARSKGPAS
jgi:hypothetical protein